MKTGHKLLLSIAMLIMGFLLPSHHLISSMLVIFLVYVGIRFEVICLTEWRIWRGGEHERATDIIQR